MLTTADAFTTEDLDYLDHDGKQLKLRLFRPQGNGPFPAVIELHGGAWCSGDLNECQVYAEGLSKAGIAVAAIDFRHAGDGYPASLLDINYAIRWVKANAARLGTSADRIGIAGQSSGGHLAMLAAMRPADPRYAAIPLPAGSPAHDASVRAVAMLWPVINPLSRYRHALRERASATPAAWQVNIPERHDLYWKTEANMAEGNPMLALERGEKVQTPPALWLQGRPDVVHDYRDPEAPIPGNEPERFTANYLRAGGEIDLVYIDQAARQGSACFDPVAAFFHKHLQP
jgi:acetyl esterase